MIQNTTVYDEFIDANLLTIDWEYISQYKILTERQLIKYQRYIIWPIAIRTQVLTPKVCQISRKYI